METRDGVFNEGDVEAPLEKTKSARSVKDPKLVSTKAVPAQLIILNERTR